MDDKNSKPKILILVILAMIVPLAFYLYDNNKSNKPNEIQIVTDYNAFYTVDSCINRFISYLNSKNDNNLKLVITDSYKKKSSISDLYNIVPNNSEFDSRKMYYEEINKDITKYYVQGYVISDAYDVNLTDYYNNRKNLYFIVYLNSDNNTFSIEPYSGDIFIEGVLNE